MDSTNIIDIVQSLGLDAGIFIMLYLLLQKFINQMSDKLDKLVESVSEIKGMLTNGKGEGEEDG